MPKATRNTNARCSLDAAQPGAAAYVRRLGTKGRGIVYLTARKDDIRAATSSRSFSTGSLSEKTARACS